jgi:hypothetical protein
VEESLKDTKNIDTKNLVQRGMLAHDTDFSSSSSSSYPRRTLLLLSLQAPTAPFSPLCVFL